MIAAARRRAGIYGAIAGMVPKMYLAYSLWVWIGLLLNLIGMTVFVYFWRGLYAGTQTIAGLTLQTTLSYILLARVFEPLGDDGGLIFEFGYNLREGGIAHVLLRPLNMQAAYYAQNLASLAVDLLRQAPLAVLATLLFGLRWSSDPRVWGAFVITALLGRTIMFFFGWVLASLTFYTTEVWGLGMLFWGVGMFLSGGLVPLTMMPDWLRTIVSAFPYAQSIFVPLSILSGITPLSEAPRLWLTQVIWLVGLAALSRVVFAVALRKVTVQGG